MHSGPYDDDRNIMDYIFSEATLLLIVIAIISIIGYDRWFISEKTYEKATVVSVYFEKAHTESTEDGDFNYPDRWDIVVVGEKSYIQNEFSVFDEDQVPNYRVNSKVQVKYKKGRLSNAMYNFEVVDHLNK